MSFGLKKRLDFPAIFLSVHYLTSIKPLLLQAALFALSFTAQAQTTHKRLTHHPAAKVKVKNTTRTATGPKVYYCASGNTVNYHASPDCRGLARCGASVLLVALAAAQQRMEPYKWCY